MTETPRSRIAEAWNALFGRRTETAPTPAPAATPVSETTGYSVGTGRPEDKGFRKLSSRSEKELTQYDWKRQQNIAYHLWLTNPFAKRIVEIFTDFVVGDGYSYQTEDEKLKAIFDAHWTDPDNAWDRKQFERANELGLFGCLILKPFVNTVNGAVKLSTIDPAWVVKFIPSAAKAGVVEALEVSYNGKSETWKVVSLDENPNSPNYGLLSGEVFYFPVNKLSYVLGGLSDLFTLADWLDAYDQFLFDSVERAKFLKAHLYSVKMTGADPAAVQNRAKELELNPPRPGGFRVHNEKEEWDALAPELGAGETEVLGRLLKLNILGSAGLPEHWFADGGEANKATAAAMGAPILKKMKRRQAEWRDILVFILTYVRDRAIAAGKYTREEAKSDAGKFVVVPPEIDSKDRQSAATTLSALTDSLVVAVDREFTDQETARKLWAEQASLLGEDVEAVTDEKLEADAPATAARNEDAAREIEGSLYGRKRRKPGQGPAPAAAKA